jgi:hypothetical protein
MVGLEPVSSNTSELPSRGDAAVVLVEVVDVEDEEVVDVEDEEVVDEVAGLRASTMTPKSFPCVLPNDNVAEDSVLESASYWA